jgi:hypothetical protein
MPKVNKTQARIYAQLRALERGEDSPEPVTEKPRTAQQKAQVICRLSRMFEDGWLSADSFLLVTYDVMRGE